MKTTEEQLAWAAVEALEATRPAVVELACLLSIAVRMEPELLRAVRLDAAPQLDVAVEADLWFSRIIGSRGPDAVSFVPEVRALLLRRLRGHPGRAAVRRARVAIERVHETASPALVLEERIAALTALREPGWQDGVQHELDRALATLEERPVAQVTRWAVRAFPRLPVEVQAWPAALQLKEAAEELTAVRLGGGSARPGVRNLDELARDRPPVQLRVRHAGSWVYLGEIVADRAVAVEVPATDPRLVELQWDGRRDQVAVRDRSVGVVQVGHGTGSVRLRTLTGAVCELPTPHRPRVAVVHDRRNALAVEVANQLARTGEAVEFIVPAPGEELRSGSQWRDRSTGPAVPGDADGWLVLVSSPGPLLEWTRLDWQDPQRAAPLMPVVLEGTLPELPPSLVEMQVLDLRSMLGKARAVDEAVTAIVADAARLFGSGSPSASSRAAAPGRSPSVSSAQRWLEVAFDAEGRSRGAGDERLIDQVRARGATDVLMLAHGWNNDVAAARTFFHGFFDLLDRVREEPRADMNRAEMLQVGILWPSTRWADEPEEPVREPADTDASGRQLTDELKDVFTRPDQQRNLDELGDMLERQAEDPADLERSRTLLVDLAGQPTGTPGGQASGALLDGEASEVFGRLAQADEPADSGSGGGLFSVFGRLWSGAKSALRMVTYYEMNHRAETVGRVGLGPLLGRLSEAAPGVRLHLAAHSMGTRVHISALAGSAGVSAIRVGSLVLLQATVPAGFGADGRIRDRVKGPFVATYSLNDRVAGTFYPLVTRLSEPRGAAVDLAGDPYEALGYVGFRGVSPHESLLVQPTGGPYALSPGSFFSVDCSRVVSSHGDILHRELAWLTYAAAAASDGSPRPR